ncbi:hypothetical protein M514_05943 [Trichuris suis]|uniref:Ubiquitin-conjugating enzyme E2 J2 n=1 Tax=Trichuris suis TaxID=68888 RepID=A0A085M7N7_9BILA|nr:hypothetical protein M513_05943 [Trichuris suis]KFD65555.1 hypothetical protein M514_05943 [Trichuris suis]
MEDDYERVLLIKSEVFVYRISVQAAGRGHRAANWKLDNPDWVGRARLVSIGSKVVLKLEDKTTGELFAKCPIDSYPSPAVEPVLDSSRYFVVRLQDDSGRSAWIGLGFADRADSFDLNVALRDHFRREELNEEIEREQNDPDRPKLDLGFKEGQTITLNIGKRAGTSSSRPKTTSGGDGPVPLLPPPPGHSLKNRVKQSVMPTKAGPATVALLRLRKDAVRLMRDPVPYVTAVPLPSNILEWHYIVEGPKDTPFEGGFYHGKLVFPPDYPFKPPSIYMFTPNGRFMTNCRLCLSISDFHPDTWNPTWSVGTILTGLLSFMLESSPTLGSMSTTAAEKRKYACESLSFNLKSPFVQSLFPDVVEKMTKTLERRSKMTDQQLREEQLQSAADRDSENAAHGNAIGPLCSLFFIIIGFMLFVVVARYVVIFSP